MTTASRAWLVIANGGGRWTTGEVRAQLPKDNGKTVESAMNDMVGNGCLTPYDSDNMRANRYGVTADCRVPNGVTNWEVLEAMGMQLRPDVEEGAIPRGMTVAEVIRTMAAVRRAA